MRKLLLLTFLLVGCVENSLKPHVYQDPRWDRMAKVALFEQLDLPVYKSLEEVNDAVNKYPYELREKTYGDIQYWPSPKEAMRKGKMDCTAYTITKYYIIKHSMLADPSEMHVIIVWDLKKKVYHAILVINDKVLDNQASSIYSLDEAEFRYKFIYEVKT